MTVFVSLRHQLSGECSGISAFVSLICVYIILMHIVLDLWSALHPGNALSFLQISPAWSPTWS